MGLCKLSFGSTKSTTDYRRWDNMQGCVIGIWMRVMEPPFAAFCVGATPPLFRSSHVFCTSYMLHAVNNTFWSLKLTQAHASTLWEQMSR